MNAPTQPVFTPSAPQTAEKKQTRLFVASILALVSLSFGFIIRAFLINEWQQTFNLSKTQIGSIQGAGLYPQALTILFFSLVVDRIGYGRVIAFAWVAHMLSAVITMTATSFTGLYWGTFVFALANGGIEAVVNPIVATLYPTEKTHRLNMLHAGWPGGLVVGGLLVIFIGASGGADAWRWKVALLLIPTVVYGLMMWGQTFPVQERVAAGVSYADMLKEFGLAGCLIVSFFAACALGEILQVFGGHLSSGMLILLPLVATAAMATKVRSLGRPLFVFLLVIMMMSATTELGTDSWIAALMEPVLKAFGRSAGNFVIIYTSLIMLVLRFCAGPIIHRLSSLGLLTLCSAIAALGLFWLGHAGAAAGMVFLAATLYGVGKTFFWPTMLGLVSEQFPKGGALTLSAIAAVGMISVGVLGNPLLGTVQDHVLDKTLARDYPALHEKVAGTEHVKYGLTYQPLDQTKVAALPPPEKEQLDGLLAANNQATLVKVAALPAIMFLCYGVLFLYFKRRGGYRQVSIEGSHA